MPHEECRRGALSLSQAVSTEVFMHGQCDARLYYSYLLPAQPQGITAPWPVPNYTPCKRRV